MGRFLLYLCLLCAGGLGACNGDPVEPVCAIDESRFRDLAATAGTTPRFTWCGAPAQALAVQRASSGADAWRVACVRDDILCIIPGVVYGDSVLNTEIVVRPQPLEAGTAYQLCLSGIDGRPPTECLQFVP